MHLLTLLFQFLSPFPSLSLIHKMHVDVDGGFFPCLFSFMFGLKPSLSLLIHSVMTLQETLVAEVPEKQKKLAQLKNEHGQDVYGYGAAPFDLFLCFVVFFILLFICFFFSIWVPTQIKEPNWAYRVGACL